MAKLQLEQVLVQQAQGLKTEVTAPAPTKPSRDFKSSYQSCTASKQTQLELMLNLIYQDMIKTANSRWFPSKEKEKAETFHAHAYAIAQNLWIDDEIESFDPTKSPQRSDQTDNQKALLSLLHEAKALNSPHFLAFVKNYQDGNFAQGYSSAQEAPPGPEGSHKGPTYR